MAQSTDARRNARLSTECQGLPERRRQRGRQYPLLIWQMSLPTPQQRLPTTRLKELFPDTGEILQKGVMNRRALYNGLIEDQ